MSHSTGGRHCWSASSTVPSSGSSRPASASSGTRTSPRGDYGLLQWRRLGHLGRLRGNVDEQLSSSEQNFSSPHCSITGPLFNASRTLGNVSFVYRVPGLLACLLARPRAVRAFMSCSQRHRSVGYFGTLAIWLILILIAEFVGNVVRGQGIEFWLFDFVV